MQAKGEVGKLADCRAKIGIDAAAAFSRIERIALALAEAGARHDFIAVSSAASVLALMVEEAENGIGSVRDVETAIVHLVAAIDRDCRDGDDVQPNVQLA